MTYDLYGTTAALTPASPPAPTPTTLDALAAAEWTQLPDGRWQLQWRDHTDYGDDEDAEGATGTFTCVLDVEGCGGWSYDYEHSSRGGPQERNELNCPSIYVSDAMEAVRAEMLKMVERWEQVVEEAAYAAAQEAEDEDK